MDAAPTIGWSIDFASGHCYHPTGMDVYFDPALTSSGALRVVGPFGSAQLQKSVVLEEMRRLALALESELSDEGYVVFGAYSATCTDFELSLLAEQSYWIPNIALRTSLFRRLDVDRGNAEREWRLEGEGNAILHRSGIGFRYTRGCLSGAWRQGKAFLIGLAQADPLIWGSVPEAEPIHGLAQQGLRILAAKMRVRRLLPRTILVQDALLQKSA